MNQKSIYSCNSILSDGEQFFEWELMISAVSCAEAAAIAERHVTDRRPGAVIIEMDLQRQRIAEHYDPAIRFEQEPFEVRKVMADPKPFFLRWLDALRGEAH
ncbi:MAG TPA: hypothetical protein VGN12_02985 [Pirellulales bacterium]|jgi:hypothetical protein